LNILLFLGQFDYLLTYLSSMRNSSLRSKRVALALFLCKLRLGLSNNILSSLFHLPDKDAVSHTFHGVRKELLKQFVSQHIGFGHISRQEIIDQHTTEIAKKLVGSQQNQVCCVADGMFFLSLYTSVIEIRFQALTKSS
jgi:hypothetical protein